MTRQPTAIGCSAWLRDRGRAASRRCHAGERIELAGRGTTFARVIDGPPGAPTVVLLHGWIASGGLNWFTAFGPLSQRYRVIAPDMRGHGRGIRSRRRFRLADCADDVAALLEHLGAEPAIVVGYSMGGPIAQLLWRRHPDRVAGLVLCATSYRFVRGRPGAAHLRHDDGHRRRHHPHRRAASSRASTASMRRWAPPVRTRAAHQPADLGGGGDAAARRGQADGGRAGDRQLQRPPLDRRDRRAHHGARHRARSGDRPAGAAQDGRRHPGRRGAAARRRPRGLRQAGVRPGPRAGRRLRPRPDRAARAPRWRAEPIAVGPLQGVRVRGGGRHRPGSVLRHGPRRPRRRRHPDRPRRPAGDPDAARFDILARGRRSVGVDLKAPAGPEVVLRLVEGADALLEGFRPGVAERLGIGPEACLGRNPRLVYGRMTGWGQEGPLADTRRPRPHLRRGGGRPGPHRPRRPAAHAAAQPGGRLRRRRDAARPRAGGGPAPRPSARARGRWSTPRWSTAPRC